MTAAARTATRVAVRLGLATGALTLGVGALHLPAFAPIAGPILTAIRALAPGACPAGFARVDVGAMAARHESALRAERTSTPAPTMPAFGHRLGAERQAVVSELGRQGARCTTSLGGALLTCTAGRGEENDSAAQTGEVRWTFRFASDDSLQGVAVQKRVPSTEGAVADAQTMVAELTKTLGSPTIERVPQSLGPLAAYDVGYRFHDYRADVTATGLGDRGALVRAQAQRVLGP